MTLVSRLSPNQWLPALSQHLSVLLLSIMIFFLQGPNYVHHLWDRLAEAGDSFIVSWILSWNAHALMTPGLSVWDAPIFYPVRNALAFSETLFGNLWLTVPIQYITDNPVFATNMLLFSSFILSSYCVFLLVRDVTGSFWAGLISGIIFSFNPYRWGHAGHLQLLPMYWSALSLFFANRFLRSSQKRYFILMLICIWIQYYASVYLGTMLLTMLIVLFMIFVMGELEKGNRLKFITDRQNLILFVGGAFCSVLVLLCIGLPYVETAKVWGFFRSLSDNTTYSAEPISFLLRPSYGFANYDWMYSIMEERIRSGEGGVFLGVIPMLLIVFSLFFYRKLKCNISREEGMLFRRYAWCTLLMGVFTLGPYLIFLNSETGIPLPYQLVYYLVPGAKAMRVPARFFQPLLLCGSVLCGFGIAFYLQRSRQWPKLLKAVILLAFCIVFSMDYSVRNTEGAYAGTKDQFPLVYQYLSNSENKGPVLELPLGLPGPTFFYGFKYLHYQSAHWRPLVGGMSGWFPPGRWELGLKLDHSPTPEALELIGLSYATTLVVHLDKYSETDRTFWESADLTKYGFVFIRKIEESMVWEREKNPLPLSEKLKVLAVNYRVKSDHKLYLNLTLSPLEDGTSWRCLTEGVSDMNITLTRKNGKKTDFSRTLTIPPYLSAGQSTNVILPKIKIPYEEVVHIHLKGPLIKEYDGKQDFIDISQYITAGKIGAVDDLTGPWENCLQPDGNPDQGVSIDIRQNPLSEKVEQWELQSFAPDRQYMGSWVDCVRESTNWKMAITSIGQNGYWNNSAVSRKLRNGSAVIHVSDNGAFGQNGFLKLVGKGKWDNTLFVIDVK
ncbi:MAG: hypothetical protein ABIK15_21530 [Pseudomonadota bacterium]